MKLFRVPTAVVFVGILAACSHAPAPMNPPTEQQRDLAATGGASQMNADALGTLSRFGLAYIFDSGITPAQIAARRNRYDVIYGTNYPAMWKAADPSAWVSRYYILNEDSVAISGRGLPYWQQFKGRPDLIPGSWILYACTPAGQGTREIAYTPGSGATVAPNGLADVPLDIHNPYVRDYQILSLANYAIAHGYNAIAVDEVIYHTDLLEGGNPKFGQSIIPGYFGCGIWRGSTFVRHYASRTDPAWAADVLAWITRARQLLTTAPSLAPYHLGLIINHPADYLSANEEYLLSHISVDMNETGYSDYGTWMDPKKAYLFGMTLNWTRYAQQHGVRIVTTDKFAFTPTISNEQIDYSLATYLMGNEGAEDLVITGAHYNIQPYYSQYNISVGAACGEAYRDALSSNIYLRRFSDGLAVANSGTVAELAHLPPGHLYSDMLGRPLARNPLLVAANDGYAMRTTNGCH